MKHLCTFLLLLTGSALIGCGGDGAASQPSTSASLREVEREHAAEKDDAHAGDEHAEGEHEEEEAALALTAQQIAAADIGLVEAGPASIQETLPLYGVVVPNAQRVRQVTARYPGVIRSVAKNFGDSVRQGETLATVESNESLQVYNVTSPLSGVVTARDANPGEQTGDRVLFTVADLSTVWVELSMFPRDRGKVNVGQRVRVQGPDRELSDEGRVIWLAPFGSSANQTLTARVLLDNPKGRWAPGLYVTAQVLVGETAVPVAVRNEALQTLEENPVVFVKGAHGFEPRIVKLGRSDTEVTEVLAGLQPGETYVAGNSFILKAELGKGEAEHEH
jgi:cobalt-zinc-cadmium efflux system membrane fusion protein